MRADARRRRTARIANADRLAAVQPEDLLLIALSTHGVTGPDGDFYLLPSDVAAPDETGA